VPERLLRSTKLGTTTGVSFLGSYFSGSLHKTMSGHYFHRCDFPARRLLARPAHTMQIHALPTCRKTVLDSQPLDRRQHARSNIQLRHCPALVAKKEMTPVIRHVQNEMARLAQHSHPSDQTGVLEHHQCSVNRR